MNMASWLALHFAIAVAGTWLARRYALHRNLVDQPGARRSHAQATPRGGGIAIVASLLLAMGLLAFWYPSLRWLLSAGAAGTLLVAGIGWLDDHRPLPAGLRLAVHALAAAILSGALLLSGQGLPLAAVGFGAVLVLVNVWNFMDGIDGLAASQALIAALGYGLLAGDAALVLLAFSLAAACLGFLPFNFPRAGIFLGDVGSGTLGYALALIAVLLLAEGGGRPPSAWPLLLFPLAAFLVDAALTLASRMLRGEPWWRAHVQHAYQRWSRRLGRHAPVTLAYAGWSVLGTVAMLGVSKTASAFMMSAALAWCAIGGGLWFLLQANATRMTSTDHNT